MILSFLVASACSAPSPGDFSSDDMRFECTARLSESVEFNGLNLDIRTESCVDSWGPDSSGSFEFLYEYDTITFTDKDYVLTARRYHRDLENAHFLRIQFRSEAPRLLSESDLELPVFRSAVTYLRERGHTDIEWLDSSNAIDGYSPVDPGTVLSSQHQMCRPQISDGDGLVESKFTIMPDGEVSDVQIIRAEPSEAFGKLARMRKATEIYPPRDTPRQGGGTDRFRNVRSGDWIFVGSLAEISSRRFDEADFREAAENGGMLWACGEYVAQFNPLDVICGPPTLDRVPHVGGALGHSSCDSGLRTEQQYLIWTRRSPESWWVLGAYPLYELPDDDFAITAWSAWDLLLDEHIAEIEGLDAVSEPLFDPGILPHAELDQHSRSPLYSVRGGAVLPAAGVRLDALKNALTSPPKD